MAEYICAACSHPKTHKDMHVNNITGRVTTKCKQCVIDKRNATRAANRTGKYHCDDCNKDKKKNEMFLHPRFKHPKQCQKCRSTAMSKLWVARREKFGPTGTSPRGTKPSKKTKALVLANMNTQLAVASQNEDRTLELLKATLGYFTNQGKRVESINFNHAPDGTDVVIRTSQEERFRC